MTISNKIDRCRLCGGKELVDILELGAQPPANSLRREKTQLLEKIPLTITYCRACTAVQLTETVSPDAMFKDYFWVTGTSQTAVDYARQFCEGVALRNSVQTLSVVEIASNDGTFLREFQRRGHRVLGIDPARNLAISAEAAGVPTIPEFFGLSLAKRVLTEHGPADVVIARNVIPHVPDPNDVIAGIAELLNDKGIGAIEFHWVAKILDELHYDSIYHEHYFYHSLRSISALLSRHKLHIFDVSESPISGGSLVAYFSRSAREESKALAEKLDTEDRQALFALRTWQEFAKSSIEHRRQLKQLVEDEIRAGRKIIGYGASARSSTLLNFCGLTSDHIICIADQNPLKHDHFTPGTDILITSPEVAFSHKPDTVLLLAWNFRDEIIARLELLGFHGNIIVPLPNRPSLVRL
jgi:SAM-dependent methyltransferase